jgi:hypothetical protein
MCCQSMKVKSKIFRGIEYVQLSELPKEQVSILTKTLNNDLIIKILIAGKVHHDCIQFKDYTNWFDNVYKSDRAKSMDEVLQADSAKLVNN